MSDTVSNDLIVELRNQVNLDMPELNITDFQVTPDKDHDGDSIIRFKVIYDGRSEDLGAGRVSALIRHVRPLLNSKLPNTFPIFRFLTTEEYADDAL